MIFAYQRDGWKCKWGETSCLTYDTFETANERDKGLGSRIVQAKRDTGGKNNFDRMSRTINNLDGNE